MITGFHVVVYSSAAEEVRAFSRDTLGLPFVDAGGVGSSSPYPRRSWPCIPPTATLAVQPRAG